MAARRATRNGGAARWGALAACLLAATMRPSAALPAEYEWPVRTDTNYIDVPPISVPSAFGMLPQYATEWWYYVGPVWTASGDVFSVQVQILRASQCTPLLQAGLTLAGVGFAKTQEYVFETSYGLGATDTSMPLLDRVASLRAPEPTTRSWELSFKPNLPTKHNNTMQVKYLASQSTGPVGGRGARYSLKTTGSNVSLDVVLRDERGAVLEGLNGVIRIPGNNATYSYEWANPLQSVTSGTLTFRGVKYQLAGGLLWLDRQILSYEPDSPQACFLNDEQQKGLKASSFFTRSAQQQALDAAQAILTYQRFGPLVANLSAPRVPGYTGRAPPPAPPAAPKELYRGTWLGLVFDNGVSMAIAFFWPQAAPGKQWIVGSQSGMPADFAFGTIYRAYGDAVSSYTRPGGVMLGPQDLDINIWNTSNPESSPHWRSPVSNHTYGLAWSLSVPPLSGVVTTLPGGVGNSTLPATLYITALVDKAECLLPDASNAFYEGAASVWADRQLTQRVGWAFVEQMGYN